MGCSGSRFDDLPVTGHSAGLGIISVNGQYCMKPETTTLKLREKLWSWTGDDCSIKDIHGTKWFQIQGSAMSMHEKRTMQDVNGKDICGYRKRLWSWNASAHITINNGTMVIATIKRQSSNGCTFFMDASAKVYLHNPPVNIDSATTKGLPVSIHIEGDIIAKKYDFMMGDMNTNPYKIAQVVRKGGAFTSTQNTFFLEIGPNVDIAFLCICTYALDEIFTDQ